MAIAGDGIPTCKVVWKDGALRTLGRVEHAPKDVCFSAWPGGGAMGTLEDSADQLLAGVPVRIDFRGGQYLELSSLIVKRVRG